MSRDFELKQSEPVDEAWFDKVQRQIGTSDINYDDTPIQRTASSEEQSVRSENDVLWAGSSTINEQYELERNMKELIDDGRVYPAIKKSLKAYGYTVSKIRRVFEKLTGIDPVQAYEDMTTYSIPPDGVPRYNYGWGPSKDAKADYFFILPFTSKYAIYKQTGLDRAIVYEHLSLEETRDELKKFVKDVRAVSLDSLDTDSDIIQRVASIQAPHFESASTNEVVATVHQLKKAGEPEIAIKMLADMRQMKKITSEEHEQLARYVKADDPSDMSGADVLQQREVEKYQRNQEGRTIDEEVTSVKIPQDDFRQHLEDENKVNMRELTNDAYSLLEEIAKTVPGFEIEPLSSTVDLLDVASFTSDADNHIDTGSVRFLVELTDLRSKTEKKGLVIMFIVNGKLQYSGKFKGEDNREYALSTPGINAYFDSAEGKPIEDIQYSPMHIPSTEQNGPYR